MARIVFAGGDVVEKLQVRKMQEGDRRQGTTVRVWPDPKYFESSQLPMAELAHLLRSKAVLMPGVTVSLVNEKTRDTQSWQYKGGLRDYLMQTLTGEPVIPLFEGEGFAQNNDNFAEGEGAQWCVAFTEDGAAGARELRQPDPHQRRRHAREPACATACSPPSRASSTCTRCCPRASSCCPRTCSPAPPTCCRPRCWTRSSRARSRSA